MDIKNSLKEILDIVGNPGEGLPEEVFEFIASITPMVNVDLLIRDERGCVLLARRDDKFNGSVWHIPGGIVRFRESLLQRVEQVAIAEIGQSVMINETPIAVNEIFSPHQERGHFISFLYECKLKERLDIKEKDQWEHGDLKWFETCPSDFISCQVPLYGKYFKEL